MSAPLYRIANWETLYESRDTKRIAGPLKWIPVVTKTDGFGFGMLRQQDKDAPGLLAAWYLMLGIAAKQDKADRGKLARDGEPLTADDLSLITGFPVAIFQKALSFFSQPKQGWLVMEESAKVAAGCGKIGLHNRTEQDRTEQDSIGGAAPKPAVKPAAVSDSVWLDSLKTSPAYKRMDVATEFAKAQVWATTHGRKCSRPFFVNWLNRAESNMASAPQPARNAKPTQPEPEGWRNWINENAPGSVYARGGTHEGAQWGDLDRSTQSWVAGQIGKRGAA